MPGIPQTPTGGGGGGNSPITVDLTPLVNGSTTVFPVPNFQVGSVSLYWRGQKLSKNGGSPDFSETGINQLTVHLSPPLSAVQPGAALQAVLTPL